MKRIVVLISGRGSNLRALVEALSDDGARLRMATRPPLEYGDPVAAYRALAAGRSRASLGGGLGGPGRPSS